MCRSAHPQGFVGGGILHRRLRLLAPPPARSFATLLQLQKRSFRVVSVMSWTRTALGRAARLPEPSSPGCTNLSRNSKGSLLRFGFSAHSPFLRPPLRNGSRSHSLALALWPGLALWPFGPGGVGGRRPCRGSADAPTWVTGSRCGRCLCAAVGYLGIFTVSRQAGRGSIVARPTARAFKQLRPLVTKRVLSTE